MATRRKPLLSLAASSADQGVQLPAQGLYDLIERADALVRQARIDEAITAYREWLSGPTDGVAHLALFNLGVLLGSAGRTEETMAVYRKTLLMAPGFFEPRINLGNLLESQGHLDDAIDLWRSVADTSLSPAELAAGHQQNLQIMALNHMGRVLECSRRYPEAEEALRRSLEKNPQQADVIQHWVHLRQKQCKWPVYQTLPGLSVAELLEATSPLAMLAHTDDSGLQLLSARRFVQRKLHHQEEQLCAGQPYAHQRLRVGFLSGDLCVHAVGLLLSEAIASLDRSQFEVVALDYSRDDGTELQDRLRKAFDERHPIGAMSDAQAARLIRDKEIDVLVDLHGLSSGTRPGILARRPAPVQVTWLGFIGSSALPWIDYVIADAFSLPSDLGAFFSEKVLRMTTPFLPRDSKRAAGAAATRAELGLPEDKFIFASFNNAYKLNPDMFASWMAILRASPHSVLWLLDDNPEASRNLSLAASQAGIHPDRLIFTPRTGFTDFISRLSLADLFLDNHPYNAGSTARDALAAGLPLLTLSGKSFVSRMAGSLLWHLKIPELITFSHAEYVQTAVSLSTDTDQLRGLRERLLKSQSKPDTIEAQAAALGRVLLQAAGRLPVQSSAPTCAQIEQSVRAKVVAGMDGSDLDGDPRFQVYQIAYSDDTMSQIPPAFRALDNRANPRPDWQEYWPIREFLLHEALDEQAYYGFLSPRFTEKTGLDSPALMKFLRETPDDIDVVTISPQADMGAFFLNVFEQNETFDPGFARVAQEFINTLGMDIELDNLLMDSRHIVFSNYLFAKPKFWREWLKVNESLFTLCETGPSTWLKDALLAPTTYRDNLQRKVFLSERIASLLLATQPWKVRCYSTFQCSWSSSRLGDLKEEAILSDALKIAMSEAGQPEYRAAFARLRRRLLEQPLPALTA